MGLFGIFSWIADRIDDIKWAFEDFINGTGSSSYTSSVEDRVNIEKELQKFREEISETAKEYEEKLIQSSMRGFDALLKDADLREEFSDLIRLIKSEKEKAERELPNTIINYVQEHLSENDPEFEKVLRMEVGKERTNQLKRKSEEIINAAGQHFRDELEKRITALNQKMTNRFEDVLRQNEAQQNEQIKKYQELYRQTERGYVDPKEVEAENEPTIESALYLQWVLRSERLTAQ